jgi:hypothetical protein
MEAVQRLVRYLMNTFWVLTALSHRVFAFAQVTHAMARLVGSLAYGLRGVMVTDGSGVVVEGTGLMLLTWSMVREGVRATANVWLE